LKFIIQFMIKYLKYGLDAQDKQQYSYIKNVTSFEIMSVEPISSEEFQVTGNLFTKKRKSSLFKSLPFCKLCEFYPSFIKQEMLDVI